MEPKRSLGPGQKPEVRAKYVHMLAEDHSTWTAFLYGHPEEFDEVWYDVHVGQPMAVPAGSPDYLRAVADGVSRKRIDVVAVSGGVWYVIEVKKHANMESVGQVITYRDLFVKEFDLVGPCHARVIGTTCDGDILDTAKSMNVEVIALEGVTP